MSSLGSLLTVPGGVTSVPPRKQRILAPSLVSVTDSDMGARQCTCALTITDVVNLAVYHVPMTVEMVRSLARQLLDRQDPPHPDKPVTEAPR